MKIQFFINEQSYLWHSQHDIYAIREDQFIYIELSELNDSLEIPSLFLEDYELRLSADNNAEGHKIYRSVYGQLFRESFGLSIIRIQLGEQCFELRFDVSVKKANAEQVEDMIRYLTHKQNDIIHICLSRSHLSNDTKHNDPELLLNSVATFINTLISCRLELQYHLRKRLIPIKQAAWKASQSSDIDPFDIIFNLDVLEPVLGDGDVVVNGRSFSISEIEVTTLEASANVKENAILLGGLYSMRRVIVALLGNIEAGFPKDKTNSQDSHYESLGNVLLRLTSANMKQRGELQLLQLEEFIRYFEKTLAITYQGECRPVMTPFVRASRVYRRLFEQLHDWYLLSQPSLEGRNCLAKLRSVSKLYEFVALFKLIDYLYARDWRVSQVTWSLELEFVPSSVTFEYQDLRLTLCYEAKIFPYSESTKNLELVDMKHSNSKEEYNYWCPDFILRLESNNNKAMYFILDAKYSSAETVRSLHLPALLEKYFMNMAVYDSYHQLLRQDAILSVIALFPDKYATSPVYMYNWGKYGLNKKPVRLPVITGLPILPQVDNVAYLLFDELFDIAQRQLRMN